MANQGVHEGAAQMATNMLMVAVVVVYNHNKSTAAKNNHHICFVLKIKTRSGEFPERSNHVKTCLNGGYYVG